ncbi:MAG: ubiquinol oxidase subunit II [Candidatus Dormibacteria bacterium]
MKRRAAWALGAVVSAATATAGVFYLAGLDWPVLDPRGPIAVEERRLILVAAALSLFVVLPVMALLIGFAVRYREGNEKTRYSPRMASGWKVETAWWVAPSALIGVLAVIAWNSTHALDPYAPLGSSTPPVKVQVVALDWKWLFIYPDNGVASVNSLVIPANTPVHFEVTADAPMNSFWIPRLGGQIYAMPGMATQLNLQASQGVFDGLSANFSGRGFSGMRFKTQVVSATSFQEWLTTTRTSGSLLDRATYRRLQRPSENVAPATYSLADARLFSSIIGGYIAPGAPSPTPVPEPTP